MKVTVYAVTDADLKEKYGNEIYAFSIGKPPLTIYKGAKDLSKNISSDEMTQRDMEDKLHVTYTANVNANPMESSLINSTTFKGKNEQLKAQLFSTGLDQLNQTKQLEKSIETIKTRSDEEKLLAEVDELAKELGATPEPQKPVEKFGQEITDTIEVEEDEIEKAIKEANQNEALKNDNDPLGTLEKELQSEKQKKAKPALDPSAAVPAPGLSSFALAQIAAEKAMAAQPVPADNPAQVSTAARASFSGGDKIDFHTLLNSDEFRQKLPHMNFSSDAKGPVIVSESHPPISVENGSMKTNMMPLDTPGLEEKMANAMIAMMEVTAKATAPDGPTTTQNFYLTPSKVSTPEQQAAFKELQAKVMEKVKAHIATLPPEMQDKFKFQERQLPPAATATATASNAAPAPAAAAPASAIPPAPPPPPVTPINTGGLPKKAKVENTTHRPGGH